MPSETYSQYPNDHLTRRLLRKTGAFNTAVGAFLEHLATDSIYTRTDDFDEGISPIFWNSQNFYWEENDGGGGISTLRPFDYVEEEDAGGDSWLISRTFWWRGSRRPTVMARLKTRGKFEFGFVDHLANAGFGIVTSKSTPTASSRAKDFVVACFDSSDTGTVDIVSDGGDETLTKSTPSTSISHTSGSTSLMVSFNEQGESHLWVNGIHTSLNREGPDEDANLAVWLQTNGVVELDYIKNWQERITS